jgi:hypothetical protein
MNEKLKTIEVIFTDEIPDELSFGILYISEKYGTAIHLCACGCMKKAVTPLKPVWTDGWDLIKKGNVVSLNPSIGNFKGEQFYHAHYFITNNTIQWG